MSKQQYVYQEKFFNAFLDVLEKLPMHDNEKTQLASFFLNNMQKICENYEIEDSWYLSRKTVFKAVFKKMKSNMTPEEKNIITIEKFIEIMEFTSEKEAYFTFKDFAESGDSRAFEKKYLTEEKAQIYPFLNYILQARQKKQEDQLIETSTIPEVSQAPDAPGEPSIIKVFPAEQQTQKEVLEEEKQINQVIEDDIAPQVLEESQLVETVLAEQPKKEERKEDQTISTSLVTIKVEEKSEIPASQIQLMPASPVIQIVIPSSSTPGNNSVVFERIPVSPIIQEGNIPAGHIVTNLDSLSPREAMPQEETKIVKDNTRILQKAEKALDKAKKGLDDHSMEKVEKYLKKATERVEIIIQNAILVGDDKEKEAAGKMIRAAQDIIDKVDKLKSETEALIAQHKESKEPEGDLSTISTIPEIHEPKPEKPEDKIEKQPKKASFGKRLIGKLVGNDVSLAFDEFANKKHRFRYLAFVPLALSIAILVISYMAPTFVAGMLGVTAIAVTSALPIIIGVCAVIGALSAFAISTVIAENIRKSDFEITREMVKDEYMEVNHIRELNDEDFKKQLKSIKAKMKNFDAYNYDTAEDALNAFMKQNYSSVEH